MQHFNMREFFTVHVTSEGKEYTPNRELFLNDGGYAEGPGNSFDISEDKHHSRRWGRKSGTYVQGRDDGEWRAR